MLDQAALSWWWEFRRHRPEFSTRYCDDLILRLSRLIDAFGANTMVTAMDDTMFRSVRGRLVAAPSGRGGAQTSTSGYDADHILLLGTRVLAHVARTRPDIDLSRRPQASGAGHRFAGYGRRARKPE
ncbi:hypothetical protein [Bradyrhizobium diazoefficiens]|uniref:hypothetical protein n=1 Tax=Bradyrhizobium diazoefficiens TaxID=1355477 RepID=UPI0027299F2E|nr:hypothetical protein [Bradyrhizobium diazoefficiens]WLA57488.1 hypothetical protein QIH81_01705 [Bradyrhizobium diazoefficiens]